MNKRTALRYLLLSASFVFCWLITQPYALAQCGSQSPPIEGLGFPHDSKIPVYIDPAITGARRDAVVQAFNNWQGASITNGSGITFDFVSQPPPANTGITVNNQAPASGDRAH